MWLFGFLSQSDAGRMRDDVKTEVLVAGWDEGQVSGIFGC